MGIYYHGNIYGIRWTVYDIEDPDKIIYTYEKKYDKIITTEQLQEIKEIINTDQVNYLNHDITYRVYSDYCTTYERGFNDITFYGWVSVTFDALKKYIDTGKNCI